MKFTLAEIDTRIRVKRNEQDGVQNYDLDNAYPQRIDYAVAASPRARQCVTIYAKHIRGAGYTDPTLYKAVINSRGDTADQLLRAVSEDMAKYRGITIHVDYNALGQVASITHVPFKEVRLGLPDDSGKVTLAAHHPDWGRETKRTLDRGKITLYPLFDPTASRRQFSDKPVEYKGQLLYWSFDGLRYPLASVDSVLEDVYSDNETKQFRFSNITTNFLASHVVQTDEMASEADRREFTSTLAKFQGARNGRKILHIEKKQTDQVFDIKKLDIQENDQLFQYTEASVKENIRNAFMVPPVLVGDLVAGKMGTSKEMEDATVVYNGMTYDERLVVEEITRKLVSLMPSPTAICPSGDYSVKPLQFSSFGPDSSLSQRQGETVAAKIVEVATNDLIPYDKRLAILTRVYGLTMDEAVAITPEEGV